MTVILDATAGNRKMWEHINRKNSEHIVFFDKEKQLIYPPNVLGVWEYLPFRDKVFNCVIFDPPHTRFGKTSMYNDPKNRWWGSLPKRWPSQFYKAAQEFLRVSDVLCFKWNETSHYVDKILPLFKPWKIKYMKKHESSMKRGKSTTWWVTFVLDYSTVGNQ
jgi:hypothetical protein